MIFYSPWIITGCFFVSRETMEENEINVSRETFV